MVTRVLAMAFLVVSALGYISASSALSTKGYEMKEVERDISALREEVQHLQIFIAQHRSLARVQSRIPSLGLVPLDTISYVDIRTGASFAQR